MDGQRRAQEESGRKKIEGGMMGSSHSISLLSGPFDDEGHYSLSTRVFSFFLTFFVCLCTLFSFLVRYTAQLNNCHQMRVIKYSLIHHYNFYPKICSPDYG